MRIAVHDYCGHPFQVQLSRGLARRGHVVLHLYSPSVQSAHGALTPAPDDPPTFAVAPVSLDRSFEKYRPSRRVWQELVYGRRLVQEVRRFHPDTVLSANTPLLAQRSLLRAMAADGVRFVFWQQDVLGAGIRLALQARFGGAGSAIGRGFEALEEHLLRASSAVVTISDDFAPILSRAGVDPVAIHVVENWAPISELPMRRRDNPWAAQHGLVGAPVLLYAGTLGLKHNPRLLLHLASAVGSRGIRVVVVSEGPGAEWLRHEGRSLDNLVQLPYQPYACLPDVLGTGDVLMALLDPEAGTFSVPSKVLSYLCAGRPVLAAVPARNLAARVVCRSGAGLAVDPGDADAFVTAALQLLADGGGRGAAARAYAERTFDLAAIGDRFESILTPGRAATGAWPGLAAS